MGGEGRTDGGTHAARRGGGTVARVPAATAVRDPGVPASQTPSAKGRKSGRGLSVGAPVAVCCGLAIGVGLAVALIGGSGGVSGVTASGASAPVSEAGSPDLGQSAPALPLVTSPASATRSPTSTASHPAPGTASAGAGSSPGTAASGLQVGGLLSCTSGASVEGVWVQTAQGSGFAPWQGIANSGSVKYWYTLPTNEPYSLHVGCGGSTSAWAVSADTPTVTGAANSFACDDVSGQAAYGTCTRQ